MTNREVAWALKCDLDRHGGQLSTQLAQQIRNSIAGGELIPGDRVPASRALARELNVARGTVTTAMDILIAEGLLEARAGSGTYISSDASFCPEQLQPVSETLIALPHAVPKPEIDQLGAVQIDFRPCRPSLESFPLAIWRRCLSSAGSAMPSADYGDPRGDERLRNTLVTYLRRARGLSFTADQIIITNGAVHAMHLLSSVYLDHDSKVVVENPGYRLARQTFRLAGADIIPCAVDSSGLVVDELPSNTENVRFVCVTPSHQFPTGSRLSLGRRRELISWAEERGILIIEDDYDGEFRYDVSPLAPLAAMSNGCVVYCGTFSKTLFPGLRIGFAVAPKRLIDTLAAYRSISEYAPNTILQSALAKFISEGHHERHIHKMRRIYAQKRKTLAESLRASTFAEQLQGLDSGLNALVKLKTGLTGTRLSAKAKHLDIVLPPVRHYALDDSVPDDAVVFGYAGLSEDQLVRGVEMLNTTSSAR
ncbi:MAG TPA: PLP-dependent aminotransferase family protein [Woeseiaceae bacterium]|nr:PLP-dependent aminotransferase family protein [Woeseiaceae bacterium]